MEPWRDLLAQPELQASREGRWLQKEDVQCAFQSSFACHSMLWSALCEQPALMYT